MGLASLDSQSMWLQSLHCPLHCHKVGQCTGPVLNQTELASWELRPRALVCIKRTLAASNQPWNCCLSGFLSCVLRAASPLSSFNVAMVWGALLKLSFFTLHFRYTWPWLFPTEAVCESCPSGNKLTTGIVWASPTSETRQWHTQHASK